MAQRNQSKKKPTAKTAATRRVATRANEPERSRAPVSQKQRSQSRYPGETPLTGEDRPARRSGGKKQSGRQR